MEEVTVKVDAFIKSLSSGVKRGLSNQLLRRPRRRKSQIKWSLGSVEKRPAPGRRQNIYHSQPTSLGYSSLAAPGSYCVTMEAHSSVRIPTSEKEERMDLVLLMDELRIAGLDNNLKTMGKHSWNGH